MKNILPIFTLFIFVFQLNAQGTVKLHCKLYECENSGVISVYEPAGLTSRLVMQGEQQADGNTIITMPKGEPKVYLIGPNQLSVVPVILGSEDEVTLWGTCSRFQFSRTTGSEMNKALEGVKKRIETLNSTGLQLAQDYRATLSANVKGAALESSERNLERNNEAKKSYVDSLKKAQPLLGRYAALFLHPEYVGKGPRSEDAFKFTAKNYFQYADLSDAAYSEMPQINDAFAEYANAMLLSNSDRFAVKNAIIDQLGKLDKNSPMYRTALGGLVSGMKSSNSPLFFDFGELYIKEFEDKDLADIRPLKQELNRAKSFMTGIEAPILEGQSPEGKTISMKDYRGKVLLVDFWASWCGPCRKENPNVKLVYEKYKDKGFDILGVSLDRDQARWVDAIEKDGLPWKHISDLKGWQSDLAAVYGITSIPHTVLVDAEGNIIVRNLRGPALENKLKELFGE